MSSQESDGLPENNEMETVGSSDSDGEPVSAVKAEENEGLITMFQEISLVTVQAVQGMWALLMVERASPENR